MEMEAAGPINVVDTAGSHKNEEWLAYAAAGLAKELLSIIPALGDGSNLNVRKGCPGDW